MPQKERGIQNGDIVRVFKSRGVCLCAAVLSDHIRPGVIQISTGAWFYRALQDFVPDPPDWHQSQGF